MISHFDSSLTGMKQISCREESVRKSQFKLQISPQNFQKCVGCNYINIHTTRLLLY
jgi:hypothetical protein